MREIRDPESQPNLAFINVQVIYWICVRSKMSVDKRPSYAVSIFCIFFICNITTDNIITYMFAG